MDRPVNNGLLGQRDNFYATDGRQGMQRGASCSCCLGLFSLECGVEHR